MARTFLVTGGCGFIGSHLCDALRARGDAVRILDDLSTGKRAQTAPGAELLVGDVGATCDVDRAAAGVDGIFHLAAVASVERSNEDWRGTHRTNQTGSVNVFEAARRARASAPVRVVYASSAAVYGDPSQVPLPESAALRPLTAYGADKLGSELHARVAAHVHGVTNTGLRFFNVYGPRQDPGSPYSGVISIFASRIANGRAIDIHGDGGQVRDFVFVADVVRYLLAAMDRTGGSDVFNVCTGVPTTIRQLAETVMRLARRDVELRATPPRTGDIRTSLGDPSRAAAALGVRATVPLDEGLTRVLAAP